MKKQFARDHRFGGWCRTWVLLLAAGFLLANLSPAGQKDKKKKKDEAGSTNTTMLTDEQQIDYMLSEMLGAMQVGDIEKLHSTYADDVSIVSDNWAPPIMGWANYLAAYQQQHAHTQRVRMDRTNTYIKVKGAFAWACYQWTFIATVDGQPLQARGQTTVVMEKRNGHWVIVHNHSSVPPLAPANTPAPQQTPAKPNGF